MKGTIVLTSNRIARWLFLALPFIDAANGFFIRNYNIYGIGSYYHLFAICVLFCITYFKKRIRLDKIEIYTAALIFLLVMSSIGNMAFIGSFASISLERVEKIICTALFICILYRLRRNAVLSLADIESIIRDQCFLVPVITLIANITRLGNVTYQISQSGRIGFYTGSNEPIAIFIIIGILLIFRLEKEYKTIELGLFLVNEVNLVFVQSKASYASAVYLGLMLFIVLFRMRKPTKGIQMRYIVIGIPVIILGVYLIYNLFLNTISSFIVRQSWLQDHYLESGLVDYLTSGRTTRFASLFGGIKNRDPLIQIFQVLFGQGLNFEYSEIFEMDLLDVILYGGVVSALLIVIISYHIIKLSYSQTKNKLIVISIVFLFIFSFFAGHLWTGGASGIYLGLFSAYLMTYEETLANTILYR